MPEGPKHPAKSGQVPSPKEQPQQKTTDTMEARGYLSGMFTDFNAQITNYLEKVHHLLFIQAQVEVSEKNLANTRDYFEAQIARCKGAVPDEWSEALARARFVHVKLSDACMALLREHRRLSQKQMLDLLNEGQYRFRTPTPFREIHGAMIKQTWQLRDGDEYVWNGPDPQLQLVDLRFSAAGGLPEPKQKRVS